MRVDELRTDALVNDGTLHMIYISLLAKMGRLRLHIWTTNRPMAFLGSIYRLSCGSTNSLLRLLHPRSETSRCREANMGENLYTNIYAEGQIEEEKQIRVS